ncbi:hypothetical protein SAMN04488105_111104 [Salipiger thiooxidans]|uniref:Uncharacterized protein n=1 Tax=Salipiger thiooxidans TaxID=282683 RepID=A0A1G7HQB5_9RHOB|nr:hypothetical protein [Salipiger thiooxidans]SDF02611.1 hypothetical protein SAMN04488105_111104 [Salipiger thiooxidans]
MQLDGSEGAAELDRLHGLGVRGVRINLHRTSANDIAAATARIDTTAATCAVRSWYVYLFAAPSVIAQLQETIAGLAVPMVPDHVVLLSLEDRGRADEGAMLSLFEGGIAWGKLSAPSVTSPAIIRAKMSFSLQRFHPL